MAGEVEATHKQLSSVRAELAPWEAKIAAAKSRLDVATAERDLLLKQGADAQQRLEVLPPELTVTAGSIGSQAGSTSAHGDCLTPEHGREERSSLVSQRYMHISRTLHLQACSGSSVNCKDGVSLPDKEVRVKGCGLT